ncbi:hypothetical protein Tco_0117481 [Tanacetum coccineum]
MLESEAYMTYRAYATGEKTLKPKTTKKKADSEASPKMKTTQATKGKRIKSSAKGDKAAKKKKPAETSMDKGLTMLSDVALTEAEQLKLVIERSKTHTHSSHASGSGVDEGTGKSSDEEDDDEVSLNDDANDDAQDNDNQDDENQDDDDDDEQTNSNNNGDDFVHPKFSTHDDDARQEEVNEEDSFDPRVQTPSHDESTDDDNSDKEVQGTNTEEEEMVEEATHEEDEANELYRDMNINLEGRDTMMTDAPLPNVQATQETEDTHVILTAPINPEGQQQSSSVSSGFVSNMLNPRPDTGIDSIFNTEATSLVDVPVTTIAEPPLVSATTLPPPSTHLITHLQQTPVPTPAIVPSSSLQDLPNFGSLFGFDHRLKTLETNFSEFKQTNQFAEAVSSIPGIVDAYLANKMHEAVKTAVQLQSERLRDEAQAENADFLNKLDDNIKKIIKDQVKEQVKAQVSKILPKIKKLVNDQLESEVLIHSSNEAKTSHAVAANLSELELKKILIDKMKANKSIDRSDIQKNLYKALVDAYDADKDILDAYGDTVTIKRRRDDADDDEEPFAGSNRGSKRRGARKEPESTSAPKEKTSKTSGKSYEGSKSQHKTASKSAQPEEPMHTAEDLEEPAHQEFETGGTEDQPDEETSQHPDWFQKPAKLPTPNREWNKTLPDTHGPVQPDSLLSPIRKIHENHLHELKDPPLYFSALVINRLKITGTLNGLKIWSPTQCGVKCWESARDVYSKHRIIRRDDDKLYKFKEGDFNRLRIQDIEDMLLLLVQGKLTNLTVKERLAFNVSLRMFTRSVVIQRRVEDLQLLCRLKGIRMQYLPQTIWRQRDKDNAGAMIQAIDKQLKTRRIMRSLEKFVGGRPYEGDFRLLQRTI